MIGLRIEDIERKRPELFGHILENYAATELVKQLSFTDIKAQLYHFRTSDGYEVDFVLEKPDGSVFAIEVKKSEAVDIKDFKGIQTLANLTKDAFEGGIILYTGKQVVRFGKNLWAVPMHVLWQ
jgi:predicted AAA+ superfamily ATPase